MQNIMCIHVTEIVLIMFMIIELDMLTFPKYSIGFLKLKYIVFSFVVFSTQTFKNNIF